jgi:hypothetical protein
VKAQTLFIVALLAATPLFAKPKVNVQVKVNEGAGRDRVQDSISKGQGTTSNALVATVWFLNVTVTSDNAEAVAKGNGQWCITGDAPLDVNGEYEGMLDGTSLDVQVPGKNGKIKKLHFDVFDHKWRKLADL